MSADKTTLALAAWRTWRQAAAAESRAKNAYYKATDHLVGHAAPDPALREPAWDAYVAAIKATTEARDRAWNLLDAASLGVREP